MFPTRHNDAFLFLFSLSEIVASNVHSTLHIISFYLIISNVNASIALVPILDLYEYVYVLV